MGLYGLLFLWETVLVQLNNKPRDAEGYIEQSELYTYIMYCAMVHTLFSSSEGGPVSMRLRHGGATISLG